MRQSGYYWILLMGSTEYVVAEWNNEFGRWYLTGTNSIFFEHRGGSSVMLPLHNIIDVDEERIERKKVVTNAI